MKMSTIELKLTGISAILMHSDRGANPLDPAAKAHKALTSKRKKTDDDHEAIAKSEWMLGLYYDPNIGPYVPSANVRSSLVEGAKFNKLGATVKRSTIPLTDRITLEYNGPRDPEKLFADAKYVDCRSVKVGTSRLMRTRPCFVDWSIRFSMMFDPTQIEQDQLLTAFENAGAMIGLGDFRPTCSGVFGRYRPEIIAVT
jgi:hypothetical protein